MCHFFSCIVMPGNVVHWTERDQHEHIIKRLGIEQSDKKNKRVRNFLRIEVTASAISVDEPESEIPSWYHNNRGIYVGRIEFIYNQVRKLREEYNAKREKLVKKKCEHAHASFWWEYYYMREKWLTKAYYNKLIKANIIGYVPRRADESPRSASLPPDNAVEW